MAERWLIVAHDASNSGAPRMLLEVLRGVRTVRGPDWSCEILLVRGGVLTAEFQQLGLVRSLAHPWAQGRGLGARLFRKLIDLPLGQPRRLRRWSKEWRAGGFDLVYNNTSTNGRLLPLLGTLGCPILTHVHELDESLRRFNASADLALTLNHSDHFLAVSQAVARDLGVHGIPPTRVTIVPNFLPALPPPMDEAERMALRQRLPLPPDAFIVAGCGHIDRFKGTDLFVAAAESLRRRTPRRLLFIWIGGATDLAFARHVRQSVRRQKLEAVVRFIGAVADARPWLAASDLVAVTSRVESFSMVALEAGAQGRPVVGFAAARGLADLLEDKPDQLIPELDPEALAAVIDGLMGHPEKAVQQGQLLRAKIGAEFLVGPRVQAILTVVDGLKPRGGK